jgi:hypothetical protein
MTDPRRVRAEDLVDRLDDLARDLDSWGEFGLPSIPEEREKCIQAVMAFERLAEARVYQEAGEFVIETDPEASAEFLGDAKRLREEARG